MHRFVRPLSALGARGVHVGRVAARLPSLAGGRGTRCVSGVGGGGGGGGGFWDRLFPPRDEDTEQQRREDTQSAADADAAPVSTSEKLKQILREQREQQRQAAEEEREKLQREATAAGPDGGAAAAAEAEQEESGAPLTKEQKHKRKIAKSQRIMRELERTVGVRYAVNRTLQPLKQGNSFPTSVFPIVMRSLAGTQLQLGEVCAAAPATVFLASANNAASQPTVTRFHDAFEAHFGSLAQRQEEAAAGAAAAAAVPQAFELSIASTGLLQQFMGGLLEGFLRRGTPEDRQAATAYIAKNTPNVKLALGMDDILVGFFYVVGRDGIVHVSGRCDEHNVDVMLAAVEEVVAAEAAAKEAAERRAADKAAEEAERKRVVDAKSVAALKKKAVKRVKK